MPDALSNIDISTHSLTRRLTLLRGINIRRINISTHSLTRRLTAVHQRHNVSFRNFNSQPHEEADSFEMKLYKVAKHFNSQPHEEADV